MLQKRFQHDSCLQATFDQASGLFGQNSGLQCLTNPTCALIESVKQCSSVSGTGELNEVLQTGNTLYETIGKQGLLLPSDIPKYLNIHGTNYNIVERMSHIGSFLGAQEEFRLVTINMLNHIFIKYKYFLLCVQDSTAAVVHACNGLYYLFDPHSRNSAGFPVSNGSPVMLSFMVLTNLQTYVTSLAVQLNASTFELTPLNIRADIQPLEMKAGFA